MQDTSKDNIIYRHGGDIYHNNVLYDFSVNTNPLGMPPLVKQKLAENMDMFERYPDMQCGRLREAISLKEDIGKENILCGNGASEVFHLIAGAVKPYKAMVTAPAFSGYEYALRAAGAKVEYYYLEEKKDFAIDLDILDKIPVDCGIIFLCSPCNPSGRIINKKILLEVLSYCESNKIYLVADECFLGFVPDYEELSMKSEIQSSYLIVVNAFTKLYAMAGLRLGWCACGDKGLIARMQQMQPEWSVSVPAQIAGIYALKDNGYVLKTRSLVARERARMTRFFESKGIKVFPSDSNFLLVKSSINLYRKLLGKQVLIRECSNFKGLPDGFYRIAIRTEEENNVLISLLDS
ncbi:MAG: histidinol-phosphate transaminase [Lachnospiraceae bacterium]|nr:histidinol-phosphate transaminase [Lachnospiraceae bacterium]